jgi:hypothetical protein
MMGCKGTFKDMSLLTVISLPGGQLDMPIQVMSPEVNNQRQPFAAGQWVKLEIILTMQTMNKLTVFLIPRLRLWLERTVLSVTLMAMAAALGPRNHKQVYQEPSSKQACIKTDAQLATTPGQRQIGLMNRKDMATHEGMLFIFEEPQTQCFWMKNTLLPFRRLPS